MIQLAVSLLLLAVPSPGTLANARLVGEVSPAEVQRQIAETFGRAEFKPKGTTGARLYTVQYWSVDSRGAPVLLSGFVALPDQPKTKGLVLYCHGSTANRKNVPSAMTLDEKQSEDSWLAMLAFAGGGYAFAAPDYLGLGWDTGTHPFAQSVNALSGRDLIVAARTLAGQRTTSLQNRLYVTGYSEGGGIAMWTARRLWESANPRMHPTAAAPISGAYDLSGTMAKLTVKRARTPIDTGCRMYFMAYFARGLADNGAQIKLEDLFVPSFASYIATAFERGGSDHDVGKRLGGKVIQVGGLLGVQRVIQKPVLEALAEGDPTNPLIQLLAKHDCYSWKPGGPLYMVGLQQDGIVPFSNTVIAARAMRGPNVRHHAITTRRMDHEQATAPSLGLVRAFFDGGFAAVPSDPLPKLK